MILYMYHIHVCHMCMSVEERSYDMGESCRKGKQERTMEYLCPECRERNYLREFKRIMRDEKCGGRQ